MKAMARLFFNRGVRRCVLAVCLAGAGFSVHAQQLGVKTNVLYDALTTMNVGLEYGVAPRWTVELSGAYNPWTLNKETNKKVRSWGVFPEARYWFCERFQGHFLGLHSGYAQYNMGGVKLPLWNKDTKPYRYQGWGTGVGVAYGYSWILGKRWNLETTLGLGYVFTKYDKYACPTCGKRLTEGAKHHYLGPTKAGISIIYMIK